MKLLKQFVVAGMLLNSFTTFAGSANPCNDGFCDKPSTGCHKKRVTTNKLFVKDAAKVCGDLTVKGEIHNLELQLMRDNAVPPTDEVYTQFFQYPFAQNILENIQDFSVPRNLVVPGTEINPDAPVYGYNAETQELILGGGPELSYNPDFTEVNLRYHGQNPQDLIFMTFETLQACEEHTLSYFLQRGYEMPGVDVYPQYEGQFIFNNNVVSVLTPSRGNFVGIKFYFEDGPIPVALDLAATAVPSLVALDLFEADPSLHKNGFYYPTRIPITTDFAEFNSKFNTEPIVYYDNLHRRITIHVPECNNAPTNLFGFKLAIPCCNCNVDIDLKDNLVAFDGTFNLMRRNPANQLVSSGFDQLEYLIQASSVVSVKSELIDHGQPSLFAQDYNFSEPGGVFTGLAIPLMNGAGPQADIYAFNPDNVNAFSRPSDPLIFPALENGSNSFQAGDNPLTTLIENYGTPTYNGYFDSDAWFFENPALPLTVMEGKTTPEENPAVPFPDFDIPNNRRLNFLVGHETLHNTQVMQGMIPFLSTEGHATGVELDPKLNSSTFSSFRPGDWRDYLPLVTRGEWPVTLPEITAEGVLGVPTYGSSIFWRYLATQFDYNYQVVRRMGDIMSHETFGPLLEANGIPFQLAPYIFGGEIGFNPAGSLLAFAQALNELHGKNVQDVFSDYAISLAMLRNNTSIPAQYRHAYPYWLASPTYPGYEFLSASSEFATWWQDYQDNTPFQGVQLTTLPALPEAPFAAFYFSNGPRLTTPLAAQGEITNPTNACSEVQNNLTGKIGIALFDGACGSRTMVANTEAAGNPIAATLIISDNNNPLFFGNPDQTQPGVGITQEDGAILLAALEVNPTLTLILEPFEVPFIPVLDQDVIDAQTQDMTLLLFEVPADVNTVTVDVAEGEWRLSVVQFTSDGTPVGQFLMQPNDGPVHNNGGQTVFDISQFPRDPESGSVRLVCANVGIHDYEGLNNWCGINPIYTGRISILRS